MNSTLQCFFAIVFEVPVLIIQDENQATGFTEVFHPFKQFKRIYNKYSLDILYRE